MPIHSRLFGSRNCLHTYIYRAISDCIVSPCPFIEAFSKKKSLTTSFVECLIQAGLFPLCEKDLRLTF